MIVAGKIEYENLKKLNLESPYDIASLMIMDHRPTLQIPPKPPPQQDSRLYF